MSHEERLPLSGNPQRPYQTVGPHESLMLSPEFGPGGKPKAVSTPG